MASAVCCSLSTDMLHGRCVGTLPRLGNMFTYSPLHAVSFEESSDVYCTCLEKLFVAVAMRAASSTSRVSLPGPCRGRSLVG